MKKVEVCKLCLSRPICHREEKKKGFCLNLSFCCPLCEEGEMVRGKVWRTSDSLIATFICENCQQIGYFIQVPDANKSLFEMLKAEA